MAPENTRDKLKKYARLAPQFAKLIGRLMKDSRVPARQKAILVVVGAYLVSPIDVIPDFIPGIGVLDDLVIAAFALDQILNRVPEECVREHWEGDEDVLAVIKEVLDIASGRVPDWLKRRLTA
ncbi:MAG TPA: DUF1232 domain-containing protein [Actinomycetota bacterium]|jgi:uncharacterized membrane protein YkvA (DUF1232 family)|nr:DUF1232 domain-containing protein [Actinomycetota bacterium]